MSITSTFNELRPLLFSIAYRMTGNIADSEDILQDTFEKWLQLDTQRITHSKAYLCKTISNRCINYLQKKQKQREIYKGTWLPEPLIAHPTLEHLDSNVNLSYGILWLLEKLNPLERAVYLCKESFDFNYSELANIFEKRPDHCRQLYHRASQKLQIDKKRFEVNPKQQQNLLQLFAKAAQKGDMDELLQFLKDDIVFYSDGGGKATAALNPLYGKIVVAKFLKGIIRKGGGVYFMEAVIVNQSLGTIIRDSQTREVAGVFVFEWQGKEIQNIYVIRNPDKLGLVK
ncbi:MAG: sigma-70 family RNA polymerase sigma factor [Chitinophagales bacterium]